MHQIRSGDVDVEAERDDEDEPCDESDIMDDVADELIMCH